MKLFRIIAVIVLVGTALSVPLLHQKVKRSLEIAEQQRVVRPEPEPMTDPSVTEEKQSSSSASSLRAQVNWDVPFTPQAPLANWDELHEEACEEASVLMVLRYFAGQDIASSQEAEEEILRLVSRNTELGFPVDDTAEQVRTLILDQDPSLSVALLYDPTPEALKAALSAGSLIIVPAQGRMLGNPYFTAPGPIYHMLVLRGYTEDGFVITNDPGTKRGKEYVYSWERLLHAVHDWNGGDVDVGAKVAIIISR